MRRIDRCFPDRVRSLRLTQIKLAGFKSFVDPTTIGTPGQLVGIVGPNGCGKSNVIDAVRWVLGESKASALRGESMQDVIFNGAGDRKPVGRAAVELHFDNSAGRIGGQWGQYAEISIKRVLTRDGDSSYYINNIPVRRRDIHDLFLGTGLGPRAYAIIEQGMISRVVEAKPEELRVFLEEAAGVSKYKERRKETEGRIADTRENLARVEDIRNELGSQLERLGHQARVATEFRELEARHKLAQQVLWYSKQQDAVRTRERCGSEIAHLTVALESLQAEVRSVEAQLERMRADHYAAGDALHDRQGAFYAANAEVTRLEQQLSFARENESRITQQVAQITEQLGALAAQEAALAGERASFERALEEALVARENAAAEERAAREGLPSRDEAVAAATRALADLAEKVNLSEQAARVAETRRDNANRTLAQAEQRRDGLDGELGRLSVPATDAIRIVEDQLADESRELVSREGALAELQARVQALQERHRGASDEWQGASRQLADLEAREQALAALQARVGHGQDKDAWLGVAGLTDAPQLWRALDVEPGWNDALESVLRERLEARELDALDRVIVLGRSGVRAAGTACPVRAGGRPPRAFREWRLPARARAHQATGARASRGRRAARRALPGVARRSARGARCARSRRVVRDPDGARRHGAVRHAVQAGWRDPWRAGAAARARGARRCRRRRAWGGRRGARGTRRRRDRAQGAAARLSRGSAGARLAAAPLPRPRARARAAEAGRRGRATAARRTRRGARPGRGPGCCGARGARTHRRGDRRPPVAPARPDCRARRRAPRTERGRSREGAGARARETRRARHAGGRLRRAQRPRSDGRPRAAPRGARGVEPHAAVAPRAAVERARIDRLVAGRGSAAAPARRTRRGRARACRRRANGSRRSGPSCGPPRSRGSPRNRGSSPARQKIQDMQLKEQAAALAEAQYGEQLAEAQADLAALPEAQKAFGTKSAAARRDRAAREGDRGARRGQPRGARGARGRAGAQGVPRRAGRRPDRSDDHAGERNPPDRPRIAGAAAADVRRRQRELRPSSSRRSSVAARRASCSPARRSSTPACR